MKTSKAMMRLLALFCCIAAFAVGADEAGDLAQGFGKPPREAGVRCWWWWLNGNVTKAAITKDLEAMADKGFSGAMIFDAGGYSQGGNKRVPAGPMYGSDEWTELYLHALAEAKRLDLKLGLSIQSGWNLGGPRVTLDDKAKAVTWSEIQVEGPGQTERQLPTPRSNYSYYRDIRVLAWPDKRVEDRSFTFKVSSQQAEYPVTNLNGGPFWVSSGKKSGEGPTAKSPEWIEVSFAKPVTVSGVELVGRRGYSPKSCRIETVGTEERTKTFHLKDGANRLSFGATTGRAFRLVFEAAYDRGSPGAPRNVQVASVCLLGKDGKPLMGGGSKTIRDLSGKIAARELGGSAPDCRYLLNDYPSVEGEEDALLKDIVDLTGSVGKGGVLKWQVPAGRWTVLRIGYTPTRAHVSTSSANWTGHALDYLSKEAFNHYWYDVVEPLLKKAGPMAGTVLTHMETDSWECGGMNWSPGFAAEFERFNKYDLTEYLPVLAGKIVESREVSNAFLADFRKTIGHCISENHYKLFAEHAARYGMGTQPECSGPHAGPLDGITNYSHSDIVMSEFWAKSPHRPRPANRFFVKQASSAAHIYGKRYVGAEAFTTIGPHWNDVLWHAQKPAMDYEFCEGLNMIFFHTFTCSPKEMGLPGQEYFAGTHVNPQVTWWDESDAFMDYINRVQFIAQQGTFVADVLYYYGDHVPNFAVNKGFNQAGALPGYDYDATNEDALIQAKVAEGRIVVPGGVRYRVLVLPDHKVLSMAALKKVEQLLGQGATVLGSKPERLVSRVGGEAAQREFHALADRLWGDAPLRKGGRPVGVGRLAWGQSARAFLQGDGVAPDFEAFATKRQADYEYIHYALVGADVYFVCNQTEEARSVPLAFRVSGKQPELWNPLTGEITTVGAFRQVDGRTLIPMEFDPHGSCFVFFRAAIPATQQGTAPSNYPLLKTVAEVGGPWQVGFDKGWGGPESVVFNALTDWTQHTDEGIRHYSGKATYTNTFDTTPIPGKRYWLRLNRVADTGIAAVRLNGRDLGVTWTKPFRIEMTDALKTGKNRLQITVVNSWRNRLVGDRGRPQAERYTQTNITIKGNWKLQPSGLLGPVEVLSD